VGAPSVPARSVVLLAAVLVLVLTPAGGPDAVRATQDADPENLPENAAEDGAGDAAGSLLDDEELDCEPHPDPDGHEPPCNPHLAASEWSANHRTSYTQGSSPYPGPTGPAEHLNVDQVGMAAAPIIVQFSPEYPDGGQVVWGSTVGFTGQVFKLDAENHEVIDEWYPAFDGGEGLGSATPSGAYNVLDRDNRLIVAREQGLHVFGDDGQDHRSPIERIALFELPDEELCRPDEEDRFVGITMTYDGHVVFATRLGIVGVVPRDPERMTPEHVRTFSLNGDRCGDPEIDELDLEEVANTLSTDTDGGIYVQSSVATWRVNWDGEELSEGWRVEYEDARQPGGRLGRGSNSSASVMGTDPDADQFVVVYDNAEVFNLLLLWRDAIPDDWEGIDGEDRRVACKEPITFGKEDPEATFSEQSVLVRGYGTLLVNDRMTFDPLFARVPNRYGGYTQIFGGAPGNEPRGMERIDWDPETRTCGTAWADPDISIPNTIPTMSAEDGVVYAVGVRGASWGLEALDWETGERLFWVPSSRLVTSNSFWAATTVGPDRSIYSGTLGGVTRWKACDPATDDPCGDRLGVFEAALGAGGWRRLPSMLVLGGLVLLAVGLTTVAVATRRRRRTAGA
jgi:hypothetical protein